MGGTIFKSIEALSQYEVAEFNIYPNKYLLINENVKKSLMAHPLKELEPEPELPHNKVERSLSNGTLVRYVGQFQGEVPTGRGHLLFQQSGDLYVCNFMFSEAYGIGQVFFGNGDYFEGEINKTQLKQGKLFYINGDVYEGCFSNNLSEGKGVLRSPDGSFYQGDFVSGRRHGIGKQIWRDGSSVEGQFACGTQLAGATHIDANGVSHIVQ